jgi:methylated-DNA-[protein]-cysteine S-methyltransferase
MRQYSFSLFLLMNILNWDTFDSPLGTLVIFATSGGIARIAWDCEDPEAAATLDMRRSGADSTARASSDLISQAKNQLEAWFSGQIEHFDLPLLPDPRVGEGFASRVLAETALIPRGQTRTYGEIAAAAGNPDGARPAGNALGANTIPIVVPCHRVVAASGLGGFSGGAERKRILLEIEAN